MDQQAKLPDGRRVPLAAELSKIKSLTTITTPPLNQAIVGGILLENGCSLQPMMEEKLPFYRRNRDQMLASLDHYCGGFPGVEWNRPAGGFFLTLRLPFEMDEADVQACARDYGVIICPMSFFALSPGREQEVRLAFSYTTPDQIEEGIRRLARYVGDRMAHEEAQEAEREGNRVSGGYSKSLSAAAEGAAR
jgi:(S)-3,5-dihydroxyphenylglycine transaminase